jgi:hypothetical protein
VEEVSAEDRRLRRMYPPATKPDTTKHTANAIAIHEPVDNDDDDDDEDEEEVLALTATEETSAVASTVAETASLWVSMEEEALSVVVTEEALSETSSSWEAFSVSASSGGTGAPVRRLREGRGPDPSLFSVDSVLSVVSVVSVASSEPNP